MELLVKLSVAKTLLAVETGKGCFVRRIGRQSS
jgi:hypothetical protein